MIHAGVGCTRRIASHSTASLTRSVSVLSVLGLFAVLLWYLPKPGYSLSRLVLFALIAGSAAVGAVGVLSHRSRVALAGVAGLVLLGFWQAVLGVFILPVAGVLLLAALLDSGAGSD